MKLAVCTSFKNDKVKTLFMNSNEPLFIRQCYGVVAYAEDVDKRVTGHINNWHYYFITEKGNYIIFQSPEILNNYNAQEGKDNQDKFDIKPFTFDVISNIDSDKVYKLDMFDKLRLVKWFAI
jgi:hypothetical protein